MHLKKKKNQIKSIEIWASRNGPGWNIHSGSNLFLHIFGKEEEPTNLEEKEAPNPNASKKQRCIIRGRACGGGGPRDISPPPSQTLGVLGGLLKSLVFSVYGIT